MKLNKISAKTTELIQKAVYTVKQAHEQFVNVYKRSFEDCCGATWEQDWRSWDDFEEVVFEVEEQIKAIVTANGMPKQVWTKFRQGCRNVVFFEVPFKFRSVSTATVVRAREMADKDTEGSQDQRINRALAKIAEENQIASAANVVKKGGATFLRLPKDGEDADEFAKITLDTLQAWLANDRVQAIIKSRSVFTTLATTIAEALKPAPIKKKKKAG